MKESNVLAFPSPTVKPGVYLRGQLDYAQVDAVNQSSLKEMLRSPRHYLHRLQYPKPRTEAMQRGTAAHTAVLEPVRLTSEYAVWEDTQTDPETGETKKRVRRGKAWDAFKAEHATKEIVTQTVLDAAMAMRDAVAAEPMARYYLRTGKGANEAALVWVEPTTGLVCKSRLDRFTVIGSEHYVIDVKGCSDVSATALQRQIANLRYHFQAAFYVDAYKAVFGVEPNFLIAAIEMDAPHDCVMYQLDDQALEQGRAQYREALALLAECTRAKSWPGVGNGEVHPLGLPAWALANDNAAPVELIIGGESVGV